MILLVFFGILIFSQFHIECLDSNNRISNVAIIYNELRQILDNIEIIITTDIKLSDLIEHPEFLSSVVLHQASADLHNFRIDCSKTSSAGIFIIADNVSNFSYLLRKICKSLQWKPEEFSRIHTCWKPYIFFIWPTVISASRKAFRENLTAIYLTECLKHECSFLMDTQIYIFGIKSDGTNKIPLIFEIYSIQNTTVVNEIHILNYRGINWGLKLMQEKLTRRSNLMGATLRAIAQEDDPEIVRFKEVDGIPQFAGGLDPQYFEAMAISLNISPIAMKATTGGHIRMNESGSLVGIGGQLLSGEADLTITHWEYLPYRGKYLDFLQPHHVIRMRGFFQQPPVKNIRDITLQSIRALGIFPACVWFLVLITLFVISTVQRRYLRDNCYVDHCPRNVVQWMIMAVCLKGAPLEPSSIHMKIGVFVAFVFGMLTNIAFSASIVSQLSVPVIPIKSFEDVLKTDMVIYKDEYTQSITQFLTKANEEGRIIQQVHDDKTISNEAAGERILMGDPSPQIFLGIPDEFFMALRASNYTDSCFCEKMWSVRVDPLGTPVLSGMMMPKGSPYRETLNHKQLQIREAGIQTRLLKNYMQATIPRCPNTPNNLISVGMSDTIIAFSFLAMSFILSGLALVFENVWSNKLTKVHITA